MPPTGSQCSNGQLGHRHTESVPGNSGNRPEPWAPSALGTDPAAASGPHGSQLRQWPLPLLLWAWGHRVWPPTTTPWLHPHPEKELLPSLPSAHGKAGSE